MNGARQARDKDDGFEQLAELLKQLSGIHLPVNAKNRCLMASRLGSVLRSLGMSDYREYAQHLLVAGDAAQQEFISSLTTNTTQFFREARHFDELKRALPALVSERKRAGAQELRVWCAAASTGQEPYTIAMVLAEWMANQNVRLPWRMLATDIDHEVLERACAGVYSEAEAESLPPLYKQKYARSRDGMCEISPQLKQLIRFAPLNLLHEPYPFKLPFDIVFCRNVLIYFDAQASRRVVDRLSRSLAPGGLLFLGHSEGGAMKSELMTSISPAAYRRDSQGGGRRS